MSYFTAIRDAAAWTAQEASHVAIVWEALPSYAQSLANLTPASLPPPDPTHHYIEPESDPEGTLAFWVILDSINFGSGYFPCLNKLPGLSGYFSIASRLARRFRTQGPLGAEDLTRLSAQDCATLFEQNPSNGDAMELMGLFARALNDLGRLLLDRHGGRFARLIEVAEGSADALIAQLRVMPLFEDVSLYKGRRVPFYKRAQLMAADLAVTFGHQGPGAFRDLDQLTLFADNLVPHVLRLEGLLRYTPALAARIDSEQRLEPGSAEEIEIRACALHGVERLKELLHQQGRPDITAMALDFHLWTRGQSPAIKGAAPRHRCRCTFY